MEPLAQLIFDGLGFGLFIATREVRDNTFKAVGSNHPLAGLVRVIKGDLGISATVENGMLM